MTWRHAPHGEHGTPWSLTTVTARISILGPSCATAEKIAVRSAQFVIPYEAFSTLQPEKIFPFKSRMAAPTRNFEYGACAFFITFIADRRSLADTSARRVFLRIRERFRGVTPKSSAIVNPG